MPEHDGAGMVRPMFVRPSDRTDRFWSPFIDTNAARALRKIPGWRVPKRAEIRS